MRPWLELAAMGWVVWGGLAAGDIPMSTNTPPSPPAVPIPRPPTLPARLTPLQSARVFRELVTATPSKRAEALASRTPQQRKYLEERLREFDALDPAERELRLRLLELRAGLLPLMRLAPADRAPSLAALPQDYRVLIEQRLREWDQLPADQQQELLQNESALSLVPGLMNQNPTRQELIIQTATPERRARLEAEIRRWNALEGAQRERILKHFNRFFDLSDRQQQRTLNSLSPDQRAQTQRALRALEKLPPEERSRCLAAFERFAAMTESEKVQFLQNAARWRAMSPAERQAWRSITAKLPPTPPPRPRLLPPAPPASAATTAAANRTNALDSQ